MDAEKFTLTSDAPGKSLFMLGNEAIARGAIEAGVRVAAAYPGTPSTEIVETLLNHRQNIDMYVEWSVNEKVAFGLAFGASLCGARGLAVMKHVGLNVALDSIMTAAYIGAKGGLVIVAAEDPGQWSSQNEQDNRFIAEQAYLPVLEPSSAQEAKDMLVEAFRLSEKYGQPFILRSATRLGHSRSDITLGNILKTRQKYVLDKDPDKLVMLPAVARKHRHLMVDRMSRIKEAVNSWSFNSLNSVKNAKFGVITSGIAYRYVLESLKWLNLQDQVAVLKIGTPYPLPEKLIVDFLRSIPELMVIEELEPYLENHIKALSQQFGVTMRIHGKDLLPLTGEYSIRKVTEALCRLTRVETPIDFNRIDRAVQEVASLLPSRPPGMCAGCPHRASHFIIKTVCDKIKRETGVDPVRAGDIGCNCLAVNPPLNAIDLSTCMGGGFDLSNSIVRVTDAKIVAHLGDSTFFHSGMAPMVNAVYNNAAITMIVLDNLTTAMTGAQPSPASGNTLAGAESVPIHPEDIAKACGIKYVRVVDPHDLAHSMRVLEKAVNFKGPSFVVFRRACALIEQREKRARGEKIVPYLIEEQKCLNQSPPYCTAACPLHIDVRGYVKMVREGRYDEALNLIQEKLPFPGILGRICTQPCQDKCKRGELDEPVEIAALKLMAAERGHSDNNYLKTEAEKNRKVAVVGSGPAGLMAAYDLRKRGYKVIIFEASSELGGLLINGIPEYRMPQSVVRQEISQFLKTGIDYKLNTRLGRDIQLEDLRNQFDAVFIATGADIPNPLTIDNKAAKGAISGLDFLRDIRAGKKFNLGKRAVIIGGGNVAVDCARVCLRSGCQEVTLVYRRNRAQMPAIPEEVEDAENEGVKLVFLAGPQAVLSEGPMVKGLECVRMQLGKPDKTGRARPEPIPGSNFVIQADTIIAAVGERPDLDFLKQFKTEVIGRNGLIAADPLTLSTPISKVFAGGDAVTGPSTVIAALAAGRKAAISIDRYLQGMPLDSGRENEGAQTSPLTVEIEGIEKQTATKMPEVPPGSRICDMREVELGYSVDQAAKEASRCLSCGCQICINETGCPAISLVDEEVTIDKSQCPGCGLCAELCPAGAIKQ